MSLLASDRDSLEKRELFIKSLLENEFHRKITSIEQLGLAQKLQNNYVHLIILEEEKESEAPKSLQPGTQPLSGNVTQLIMRIANPSPDMDAQIHVPNEVAAISLARTATLQYETKIISEIFKWAAAQDGPNGPTCGWSLQERLPGEPMHKDFFSLPLSQQESLLGEVANIFKLIQQHPLPRSFDGYGGLAFDSSGEIVAGPLAFGYGGPFSSIEEMYKGIFAYQLEVLDKIEILGGYRTSGLRDRIDKFCAETISRILAVVPDTRPTLIHGDFDLQNMLWDPQTGKITGLIDFEFANVATPIDDFFFSFGIIEGLLGAPIATSYPLELRELSLEGYETFDFAKAKSKESRINWDAARLLQEQLTRAGVITPSVFKGADQLSALYWFTQEILPRKFQSPKWIAKQTDEEMIAAKKKAEETVDKFLGWWETME